MDTTTRPGREVRMDSVDLTDHINEDSELLIPQTKINVIDFNSRRLRLTVLATLYYIWTIPTISIDVNTLNGTGSTGNNSNTLSNEDKVVYRLLIAGNAFLLIATVFVAIELIWNLLKHPIGQYLKYLSGTFYILGGVLHLSSATKKWNVHCVDDYNSSWCQSAYYAVDFFAQIFSIIMAYDVLIGDDKIKQNYLNFPIIRIMIYSFMLFLTSFIFAVDYEYYITDLTVLDRDNVTGYWMVAITSCCIYVTMIIRLIMCGNRIMMKKDKMLISHDISDKQENVVNGPQTFAEVFHLIIGIMLVTGTALCWIKPSVIDTVGSERPLYRKQFVMFIGIACMIAYDLQFVK